MLSLALVCSPATAEREIILPDFGAPAAGTALSASQESALAGAFVRQIYQYTNVITDPLITDYIDNLGNRLTANSDRAGASFPFMVIQDPTVNAFAGPGGVIGIHSGLILTAENESELAGVVAHEIAHVTQQHLQRRIEEASKMQLPTAAALLAAILVATQSSQAGQAAIMGVTAASAQQQINFTRTNEQEADRVGIRILADSGFNPEGMPDFFERLGLANRYYASLAPEFLRTHPVTESRIADTRSRVAALSTGKRVPSSLEFGLIRARLRGMENPDKVTVAKFREELKSPQSDKDRRASQYGLAITLTQTGKPKEAEKLFRGLLREDPEQIAFVAGLAENLVLQNRYNEAARLYADTLKLFPGNHTLLLGYSRVLLDTGNARQAREQLMNLTRERPQDPIAFLLLSEASEKLGHPGEQHLYLAEHYFLIGQVERAEVQLQTGLRLPDLSFYDSSRMEARLEDIHRLNERISNL